MGYDEAEQLFCEIDSEGIGYWAMNYGYVGEDKKLEGLCEAARKAMYSLESYLNIIFDEHEIG